MNRLPFTALRWGTLLLAVLLQIAPLPEAVGQARPLFPALVLAYWLLETPDRIALGSAFLVGLLLDLGAASVLGEHALRLTVFAFLVQRFRTRLRFFPLWQQALAMGVLLFNDRVLQWVLHLGLGLGGLPWPLWYSPLLGFALWPWGFLLIDYLRLRARDRG
jgi:rod shape-determining protein MreD